MGEKSSDESGVPLRARTNPVNHMMGVGTDTDCIPAAEPQSTDTAKKTDKKSKQSAAIPTKHKDHETEPT